MRDITSKKIIVVEDEADIRVLYKEILTIAGFTVHVAADGLSGMEMLKAHKWDLLLLDIMLPGKDGIKILDEIKANPAFKKGKVVTLTNLSDDNVIRHSFDLGCDGYLIKSEITPDKLVEEVKAFLG
jgi:two-component system alkaline phosphatase synthesis response regulator PhoP